MRFSRPRFPFCGTPAVAVGALLISGTLLVCHRARAADVSVSEVLQMLSDEDSGVRYHALDTLGEKGADSEAALSALTEALGDEDAGIRWRAARALGAIGPKATSAVPALTAALKDSVPLVRAQAAHALSRMGEAAEAAVPGLVALVGDRDARVRRWAIQAIRAIKPDPKILRPLMVKMLEDAEPALIAQILPALAEQGKEVVPNLIAALEDKRACYWACVVLADIGPDAADAAPALLKVAQSDAEPHVRMQALLALGKIGKAASPVAPEVVPLLAAKDNAVAAAAAFALGSMGYTQADEALEKASGSDDPTVQNAAAWALAKLHPDNLRLARQAVARLVKAMENENPRIRGAAAWALLELDAPHDIVAPALSEALENPDPQVVANVMRAIASLGAKVVPGVTEALAKPERRPQAVIVLGLIGPEAAPAVPELAKLLDDPDDRLRHEVLFTLGKIGPGAAPAVPAIAEALSDEDEDVPLAACYALAKIGPAAKAAVPALKTKLAGDDRKLRVASAWAWARIEPDNAEAVQTAIPRLIEALQEGQEPARLESCAALGDIGAEAASARPALEKAANNDPSEAVRAAAAEALKKIGG